jgi:ABC-type phosphate/phosphonate transport system substrate-binding protein
MVTYRTLLMVVFVLPYLSSIGSADAKSLVIGRVTNDPNGTYKQLKPMVDYVAGQLHESAITEGSVLMAKDHEEMLRYLREGRVDWVQKGVFEALIYIRGGAAEIALRSWRQGVPTYHTVMFARKDGQITSLKDLVGKKIAFQDPGSTSAFFVPAAILRKNGFQLRELASPREEVPAGTIGYVFAGKELSITTWVHRGLANAGAYHNQNWDKTDDNPDAMKKDLQIFYQGRPMPRMIELFRSTLDANVKARIKGILLRAHDDPAARDALRAYGPRTAKFDEFVGDSKKELDEAVFLERYFDRRH